MKQTILPRQNLNGFHLNQGLLFQFILSEFLSGFEELETISLLAPSVLNGEMEGLEAPLHHLFGSSSDFILLSPWRNQEGILSKLKKYALCLSQFRVATEQDLKQLCRCSRQAIQACHVCIQGIQAYGEGCVDEKSETFLYRNLVKLQKQMEKLGQIIIRLAYYFHSDENVIFFVLRHREEFDRVFGQDFTSRFFKKMYKGGASEAERLLSLRYSERGFKNLLPAIQMKISEL